MRLEARLERCEAKMRRKRQAPDSVLKSTGSYCMLDSENSWVSQSNLVVARFDYSASAAPTF